VPSSPFHGVDKETRELIQSLYQEKDEARTNYTEETKKTDCLEVNLDAAQAGQLVAENTTLVLHAQLVVADTRVAGESFY
jgi:hypothetical protein